MTSRESNLTNSHIGTVVVTTADWGSVPAQSTGLITKIEAVHGLVIRTIEFPGEDTTVLTAQVCVPELEVIQN